MMDMPSDNSLEKADFPFPGGYTLQIFSWLVCLCQTSLLKAQGSMQKRRQEDWKRKKWWMAPKKQCLPDTMGLVHIRMHRDCGNARRTCTDLKPPES